MTRTLLLVVLAAVVVACGVPKEHAQAWEHRHRFTFLGGYTDYRGESDNTDNGYVIMSYSLPTGLPTGEALDRIHAQVNQRSECYSVLERTATLLAMRCPRAKAPSYGMWDEEYVFLIRPDTRRVYVLAINNVEPAVYSAIRSQFAAVSGKAG
jgi:hypothetical protein